MSEITAYTIRHTVAVEMRKRGVPVWEVAGFLGHTSGYKTTERYAKYGPDHLGEAVRAIDGYFADLGLAAAPLRVSPSVACELRVSNVGQETRKLLRNLVEPTGIEPVTSTMPSSPKPKKINYEVSNVQSVAPEIKGLGARAPVRVNCVRTPFMHAIMERYREWLPNLRVVHVAEPGHAGGGGLLWRGTNGGYA